jgi:AcrR family transcriptional regulator
MKKQRLTQQSWIDAGLKSLVSDGPTALAAEPLARDLATTKGSFYWHFKDVPAFQMAVAKDWQSRAFAAVVADLGDSGTPEVRLRRFGRTVLSDKQDPAMRAWAHTDPAIAKVVAQVDDERLTYMSNLLRQLGVKNANFAANCLGALVGMPQLPGVKSPVDAFDTLVDMVLALQ